jgi:hypothetical protein
MVKQKLVEIKGNGYTVQFPNIGNLQDIEAFKISYTNGKYSDMAMSGLKIQTALLDITDSVASFSVMIPELKKDLGINNWRELSPELSKELVKSYKRDFLPWFKEIVDYLYKFDEEDVEEQTQG